MDPIVIMLKEYEWLRQESLAAMNNRNTMLSFGLAAIGAVFIGSVLALADSSEPLVPSLALILTIPGIGAFVLLMWLGEYQRMHRAGTFLVNLERRINEAALQELLTWENYLITGALHMKYPYYAVALMLVAISLASLCVALVGGNFSPRECWMIGISSAIIHSAFYAFVIYRIATLRL